MPSTIDDRTKVPLRNVVALVVASVALAGWAVAVKNDLESFQHALEESTRTLSERLDNVADAVHALDGSRVRQGDILYWLQEVRRRNPTLDLPEFPTR